MDPRWAPVCCVEITSAYKIYSAVQSGRGKTAFVVKQELGLDESSLEADAGEADADVDADDDDEDDGLNGEPKTDAATV